MGFNTFEIALLLIGVVFLLLGIIGRVEAFQIKAGTDNKKARTVLIILGILFIFWASAQQGMKDTADLQMKLLKQMNEMK